MLIIGAIVFIGFLLYEANVSWQNRHNLLAHVQSRQQPMKPTSTRKISARMPVSLDANDLDELDVMFGDAGTDPLDY
jgi:hypothetical protein